MAIARTWIKITGSGAFPRPVDWNPFDNTIEAIGSGKSGAPSSSTFGGGGGSGGCYAKISNVDLPATVAVQVGTPASPDTIFGALLVAKGGQTTTLGCVGTILWAGGAGAPGVAGTSGAWGGGGGGAGGPNGAGLPASTYNGGRGDAGAGGAGGVSAPGNPGAEWSDPSIGPIGSGGGGGDGGAQAGYAGGLYGGGGAGGGCANAIGHAAGVGGQGVVVISYTPWIVGTGAAHEAPDVALAPTTVAWLGLAAASEAPDAVQGQASVAWGAVLAAGEAPDAFAAIGRVAIVGPMAATEVGDHVEASVTIAWLLAAAATELGDVALFSALAFYPHTMAAFEDADTALWHGLIAAFGPMAGREDTDAAQLLIQLGPLWPPDLSTLSSIEATDVCLANGLADPVGHLEFYGVGASTLYHAASPLERAMADVEVARMMGLPARLITENLDPWKVQGGDNLIFLAYGLGATLWEDSWSELDKRAWLASQWKFKSLVGFLPAYRMALGVSRYDVTKVITPPGGWFLTPDLTVDETNAWLRKMPQIRIKFASKTAIEGPNAMFVCPDGSPGGSYLTEDGLDIDGGRALYGRQAVLRKADGSETPLQIWDRVTTTGFQEVSTVETVSIPDYSLDGFFLTEDAIGEDKFISADVGVGRIYSTIVDQWQNVTTTTFAMTALAPGLEPLSPRFEIESDTEIDTAPSAFVGDWTPGVEYLTPDDGASMLANVMYLLDPAVAAPMTAAASFLGDARLGIPSDYAELTVDVHETMPLTTVILGEFFLGDDAFLVPVDLSAVEQAMRAIVSAKALRDTILVEFYGTPLVYVPPTVGAFVAAVMDAVEDGDSAEFICRNAVYGIMAAVEGPDLGSYFVTGRMLAPEGADQFFATALALHATATLAVIEAPDLAAFAGQLLAGTGGVFAVEAPDVFLGHVAVITSGALTVTEQPDIASATAVPAWAAALAATEVGDGALVSVTVAWRAALAAQEAADVAAFIGALSIVGVAAAAEAPDLLAATGNVIIVNAMAALEAPDVAAFIGSVRTVGALAATEAPDLAAAIGAVGVNGALAATEAPDLAAATGQVFDGAMLLATETADVLTSAAATAWAARLAVVEAPDAFFATSTAGAFATITAVETPDAGGLAVNVYSDGVIFIVDWQLATASVYWTVTATLAEGADVAAFAGAVAWRATLGASEAPDVFFATSALVISGVMAAREDQDAGGLATTTYSDGIIYIIDTQLATGLVYDGLLGVVVEAGDAAAATGTVMSYLLDEALNIVLDENGNPIVID